MGKVEDLKEALEKKKQREEKKSEETATVQELENELESDLEAAKKEAKEHYDKLLRVMAEFENFKRRSEKEMQERIKFANERLLNELIPLLDDLDRVLEHIPESGEEDVKNIALGVELLRKSLLSTLGKFDLKVIDTIGEPFDPSKHEAVSTVESDELDEDAVASVHRKGYFLGDRLLRPAMVSVVKK